MNLARSQLWSNIRCSIARPKCTAGQPLDVSTFRPSSSRLRSFATRKALDDASHSELAKVKPKSATQLRRTAAQSIPIRSNPTPTRSDIRPVSILTTAERYLLPQLRYRLPESALKLQSAWWVPRWAGLDNREGEIFVFGNGTLVCWGLEEVDAQRFAKDFLAGSVVEIGSLSELETEDVEFVTDPKE